MRSTMLCGLLIGSSAGAAHADSVPLASRLEALRSPDPVSATLHLDLRLERKLHGKSATAQTQLQIDLEQDESGLRVQWPTAVLKQVDAEAHERDRERDRLLPLREAMQELDPARIGHLLDQVSTISGLTKGAPKEETAESYEGREARRLVFKFEPRLPWTEQYYASRREGRLTLWVSPDGVPLASESKASYGGKTSRLFGRFAASTTIRTRYALEGSRLRVADREVDDMTSHDDGADVQQTHMHFVLTRR